MAQELCTATTRAGSPCRRRRVRGSDKCQAHGGAKHRPNDIIAKALDGLDKPRCRYTKRDGIQCKNPPIKGSTVCKKHGGAAAHVQRKAKERLMSMINPALVELNKIMTAPGTSDGDRLRAVSMVLDRTGYGKGMTVEHVQTKPWEVTMEHIITAVPTDYDPYAREQIEDAVVLEESMRPVEQVRPDFNGPRIGPDTADGSKRAGRKIGLGDPLKPMSPWAD